MSLSTPPVPTIDPTHPDFILGPPVVGGVNDLLLLPPQPAAHPSEHELRRLHEFAVRSSGTRRPARRALRRPTIRLRYPHLPRTVAEELYEKLQANPLLAAPYTTWDAEDETWDPWPALFEVNLVSPIPNDLALPFGWQDCTLDFEAVLSDLNACGLKLIAGGQGVTETEWELGRQPGWVRIHYDMRPNPDRLDLYYEGEMVATTGGLVSHQGTVEWYYDAEPGHSTKATVVVSAPNAGTAWDYRLLCPTPE